MVFDVNVVDGEVDPHVVVHFDHPVAALFKGVRQGVVG